jgi:MoxR-like ATPase
MSMTQHNIPDAGPGVGKSDAVRQAAAMLGPDVPVIDKRLSVEPADVTGMFFPDTVKNGSTST